MTSKTQQLDRPLREASRAAPEAPDRDADTLARIAVDSAPVMIWLADADRRFGWFNAAWHSYLGDGFADLRDDGWQRLIHEDDVERFTGICTASIDARQPYAFDYRLRRRDGAYRWVLDNGVPRIDDRGEFAGYVGSIVDIHERKELEERLAERTRALRLAERRQGVFLATLSHELRNPLAPIANAASVLRTVENGNPMLVRLREILERQVGRLGRLVEDLIDATRAAQGQISLISEPVAVETLVQSVVAASADVLNRSGHRLEVTAANKRLFIKGDRSRLTQALANIVSNAAKFTPESGAIQLAVREVGGNVEFSVRDRGQGIAADFLPHIFELFAQQDQSPTRKFGGLGVGLTVAQRIVQMHNGRIAASSDGAGKGACLVVSLPVAAGAGNADLSAPTGAPALSESYRVLIIEADDDARDALRLQMEMWGNEVQIAATAEDGVRAAEAFRPHIVLCDIGLPAGLDGFDLLDRLRRALAGRQAIFAAVTGLGRGEDEARALAAGYDTFIVKPLQPESLARLLRSCAAGGAEKRANG